MNADGTGILKVQNEICFYQNLTGFASANQKKRNAPLQSLQIRLRNEYDEKRDIYRALNMRKSESTKA